MCLDSNTYFQQDMGIAAFITQHFYVIIFITIVTRVLFWNYTKH